MLGGKVTLEIKCTKEQADKWLGKAKEKNQGINDFAVEAIDWYADNLYLDIGAFFTSKWKVKGD